VTEASHEGTSNGHPHGSIGEEAAKLAEAVQEWLGEWRESSSGFGGFGGFGGGHRFGGDAWAAATAPEPDGAECRVCPICQGLRVLRGTRPEVFEHLSDAAASMAAALRELLGDSGGPGGASRERPPDVERIDLG
jgi:hypothetical protein